MAFSSFFKKAFPMPSEKVAQRLILYIAAFYTGREIVRQVRDWRAQSHTATTIRSDATATTSD